MSENNLILALDYGGTKLTAATVRKGERNWLALERSVSPPQHDGDYERATMLALARKALGGARPAAIGVSFGGPVDASGRLVFLSHHIPGWENVPHCDQLEAAFGAPAAMANDGNIGALGEYVFGVGAGCRSLLYITVSTGVGGGWVFEGKIFAGVDGMAGEIGHTTVDSRGPLCVCGRHGCVEALACGPAFAAVARERLRAEPGAGAKLRTLADGDVARVTGQLVAQAAEAGDALAAEVLLAAARALGFGIGTAINLINPERVVVGGGVSKSGAAWWVALRAAARANALPQARVDVVPASLGDDAPLWGAVALAQDLLK
ncbi:MAG: ROK family protein [Kiritimatiellaeota bacterium]|nr:ROK family protein [Kiritimatiellota bacterium]